MSGPFGYFGPSDVHTNPINLLLFDNSLISQRLFACLHCDTTVRVCHCSLMRVPWGVSEYVIELTNKKATTFEGMSHMHRSFGVHLLQRRPGSPAIWLLSAGGDTSYMLTGHYAGH